MPPNNPIIATLVLVVLAEFIQISRDTKVKIRQDNADNDKIELEAGVFEEHITPALKYVIGEDFSNVFGPFGPFAPMFFIIEYIIIFTLSYIAIVGLEQVGVVMGGFFLLLSLIWVFLPILTIPEYEEIRGNDIRVYSVGYHIFFTLILITSIYFYVGHLVAPRFPIQITEYLNEPQTIVVPLLSLPIVFIYIVKSSGYRNRLENEIEAVETKRK
jgi:hypothetical protein